MSISYARASRIASSCPKDFDIEYFLFQNEGEYTPWTSARRIFKGIISLPDILLWNTIICVLALACTIFLSMDFESEESVFNVPVSTFIDILYNVLYLLDLIANIVIDLYKIAYEEGRILPSRIIRYAADIISFCHYLSLIEGNTRDLHRYITIICYYARLHRPFGFLWSLLDYHLIGNVCVSLLKFTYIIALTRVIYTNFFIWLNLLNPPNYKDCPYWLNNEVGALFYRGYYIVTKLFIAIGPDSVPETDYTRLWCCAVMVSGCLLVNGVATASMSLIIGMYMRPEETFRSRFRLIMNEMKETNVPKSLCQKVETFYRMYWHKQKAVSVTTLLPTFPPTLSSAIYTEIYFEAQQKSQVLRDLSYQFLSEIAKYMQTVNYIPGDTIVKRDSSKSSIIYIAFGDVEMVTAEDDDTPILRFTRGSIINPCGASVAVACARAHVAIRAATFCTAHVLDTADLWRATVKYGKNNGQNYILHSSFFEHIEKVKKHYDLTSHPYVKYKSNIVVLKRNLMDLKEARDDNGKLLLASANVFLEISGCYVMRNPRDATLTEESDPICLRSTIPCILQPTSSLQDVWQSFVAILTVIVAFIYPFQFVYLKTMTAEFRYFNYLVTLVYIMDIIIHLSTGTKLEEGVPITFTQTSSKQMMSIWFLVDVMSVAPVFEYIGDGHFSGLNKMVKLVKVFRVLKHMEDVWVYRANMFRFVAYCLYKFLICYLIAAFNQGYMCLVHKYCEVKSVSQEPYWAKIPATHANIERRLLYGLWWASTVMTFTNHLTAKFTRGQWHIQAFVMFLLDLCKTLNIMVEATYSATIMVNETMRDEFNTLIDTVKNFLTKNNVDPILRHRFITYLKLCWYTDKAYAITHTHSSILFDLPSHVHQDIMAKQRSKYILCIPFMKHISKEMLEIVSGRARLFYTSPNEILLNTGDISNEIYVIKQGFCEVIDPKTKTVAKLITSRCYFGELECLLRLPAHYTVRAVTHVQVFSVARKHLQEIMDLPNIKYTIVYAKQQPEYESLLAPQKPFRTYEELPPAPNREVFPLPRRHEPDVDFLHPFHRLHFLSVLRYVFPRFTIRPDGKFLKRYEWFRAACAFLSANTFPIYTTLVLQWPELYYFCWLLDLTAYYDIVQRMLVGYFDEKGILVYHPVSTAANYMKSAFFLDLCACFPLETLDSARLYIYTRSNAYRFPGTIQFLMYNRLVQLYRLPGALEILNDYIERQDVILMIKSIPFFMALLTLVTSFMLEYSVLKWVINSGGWALEPKNTGEFGSWIENKAAVVGYNITETPWSLVLTTYYWVTYELTTTGLDKFQASDINHLYFLFVGIILAAMTITYFTVRVISIRSNVNQALAGFQEHMRDIVSFMKKEKLDKDLQKEVISYYEYMWDKTEGTDYRSVFKMCDQITLRTDAILHIYGQTFSKCPILHLCEQSLLRVVGRAVHSSHFRQNMMIIERDEVVADMYFVDFGVVEVREEDNIDKIVKLPRGSIFGNLDKIDTTLSPNRYVASTNVHLLKINSVMFFTIIQDFPSVGKLMDRHRPINESYITGSAREQSISMTIWSTRHHKSPLNAATSEGIYKYLHVQSKGMQIYLILVSLLCYYADLYNTGFGRREAVLLQILYFLDFLFILKILIYSLMPFCAEEETETIRQMSRTQYYKEEFKYDILSCLPLEVFCLLSNDPWSIFPFLRLNRCFRLITLYKCLQSFFQKLFINLTLLTILTVGIWFSVFVHTAACIWYYISYLEENRMPKSSWRYSRGEVCYNHYICSLYFILTTFTQNGPGDILPRQHSEVVFVCILMILSTMIYVIYVGEFSNVIQYQSFRCFSFYSYYLQLQAFLDNNHLVEKLMNTTKRYTLHLWRESRGLQVPHFLTTAPQCLRLRIMSDAYMKHLDSHPIFAKCEQPFLRHLVGCFQPFYYNEDMYVVREGEITNAMYFIHKGAVEEYDDDLEAVIQIFKGNQNFGTFQGIHRNTAYNYSYKTTNNSQVLTLQLDEWEYLLEHFPYSKKQIYGDLDADVIKEKDKTSHEKKHVQITKSMIINDSSSTQSQEEEVGEVFPTTSPPTAAAIAPFTDIPPGREFSSVELLSHKLGENLSSKNIEGSFELLSQKLEENLSSKNIETSPSGSIISDDTLKQSLASEKTLTKMNSPEAEIKETITIEPEKPPTGIEQPSTSHDDNATQSASKTASKQFSSIDISSTLPTETKIIITESSPSDISLNTNTTEIKTQEGDVLFAKDFEEPQQERLNITTDNQEASIADELLKNDEHKEQEKLNDLTYISPEMQESTRSILRNAMTDADKKTVAEEVPQEVSIAIPEDLSTELEPTDNRRNLSLAETQNENKSTPSKDQSFLLPADERGKTGEVPDGKISENITPSEELPDQNKLVETVVAERSVTEENKDNEGSEAAGPIPEEGITERQNQSRTNRGRVRYLEDPNKKEDDQATSSKKDTS